MTPLPHIQRKNGFTYIQVLRDQHTCIYEQRGCQNSHSYEVFNIKVKPAQVYQSGKEFPDREVFPCNEDFGKTAWTCRTLEEATNKFKLLLEKQSQLK
jgi:hypothetical protein